MNVATTDPVVKNIERAVGAHLDGDFAEARVTLSTLAPDPVRRQGRSTIHPVTQVQVFRRDGFVCRYCGKQTLFLPMLYLLSSLYPQELPSHPNWKRGQAHPVYWTHTTSCDHVVPVARGGNSQVENLATACYMCNDIKGQWLLEELRWEVHPSPNTTWDGLLGRYRRLFASAESRLSDEAKHYHRPWLQAVQSATA